MTIDWENTRAAVWRQHKQQLRPLKHIDEVTLDSLIGIDRQKRELSSNTERFLDNKPANNALLWGARGTGG